MMEKFLSVYREGWGLSVLMAQNKYNNCILLYNNCMTKYKGLLSLYLE